MISIEDSVALYRNLVEQTKPAEDSSVDYVMNNDHFSIHVQNTPIDLSIHFSHDNPRAGICNFRDGDEMRIIFLDDKPSHTALEQFVSSQHPRTLEADTSTITYDYLHRDLYWSIWKEDGPAGIIYPLRIHPRIRDELASMDLGSGPDHVLDLLGGDGSFLDMVKQDLALRYKGNLTQYHLVDRNSHSIDNARSRFKHSETVHIHQQDMNETNISDIVDTVDLITALGALNLMVLSKERSLELTAQCYNALSPNGAMIVSGYSGCQLNSDDFKKIGFSVEGMSIPKNVYPLRQPAQLYILRKPGRILK